MTSAERAVLDVLKEPVLQVEANGIVRDANHATARLLLTEMVGRDIFEIVAGTPEDFRAYLRRCFGASGTLPGGVTLLRGDGTEARFRVDGARLSSPQTGATVVVLRLMPAGVKEFSALARQVRTLNAEIHARRSVQAALEEALRRNQLLMRELQHRVKNNMQMLLGLLDATRREKASPEVSEYLRDLAKRIRAVATVHQVMYQASDPEVLDARVFLDQVCEAIAAANDPEVQLEVSASDGVLPSDAASPLAIALNELLTNAYKYGVVGEAPRISVSLRHEANGYTMVVQDNGPGMPELQPTRRASGLGLVRGLCRQIGATLDIENAGGARVTIRVTIPPA